MNSLNKFKYRLNMIKYVPSIRWLILSEILVDIMIFIVILPFISIAAVFAIMLEIFSYISKGFKILFYFFLCLYVPIETILSGYRHKISRKVHSRHSPEEIKNMIDSKGNSDNPP